MTLPELDKKCLESFRLLCFLKTFQDSFMVFLDSYMTLPNLLHIRKIWDSFKYLPDQLNFLLLMEMASSRASEYKIKTELNWLLKEVLVKNSPDIQDSLILFKICSGFFQILLKFSKTVWKNSLGFF